MVIKNIANFFRKKPNNTNVNLKQIYSADELLHQHKELVDTIYHHSHVPKIYFETLYLYSIERLAVWVQNLPASQNHHHSHDGGFLLHTLEVVEIAIKRRNTKMLPIGASVEKQNDKKDLWTFAVFAAALLHDIGKTVSDIDIMLYNDKQKQLGRWSPWFGDMSSVNEAAYYQYQYNQDRKYQQHSLLPLAFLNQFINPVAIDWMQKEQQLFTMLLMTLQGRNAEGAVIADIVKYSDSASSAKSLANIDSGSANNSLNNNINTSNNIDNTLNTQSQQAIPKSLADKLLDTLRYLVLETDIKMNQPGGSVYTTSTDIYFVSKVILDAIRKNLNDNNQKGIPFDNSRMMDELLQFHIVTPNPKGKAIWSCKLTDGGFKRPVTLTMLKMPIDKIYFNDCPNIFKGNIVEAEMQSDTNADADSKSTINTTTQNKHEPTTDNNSNATKPATDTSENTQADTTSTLPLPPGFETLLVDKKQSNETAHIDKQSTTETMNLDKKQDKEPLPKQIKFKKQPVPEKAEVKVLETELGKDFLNWLVKVVNQKKIELNTAKSKVHIVNYNNSKALFLVSPKIFKEYDMEQWARTQKQFGRLKINLKTSTDENIWKVQTITQRKGKKPSQIRGYLIIDLEKHNFDKLPNPNKYLDLIIGHSKK
jgi:integrating conjugative element relaxase (TIGR03760 family)